MFISIQAYPKHGQDRSGIPLEAKNLAYTEKQESVM